MTGSRLAAALGLLLVAAPPLSPESVTLETYYPAPSGVYMQLIATQSSFLARDSGFLAVGTGGPNASAKLHVAANQAGRPVTLHLDSKVAAYTSLVFANSSRGVPDPAAWVTYFPGASDLLQVGATRNPGAEVNVLAPVVTANAGARIGLYSPRVGVGPGMSWPMAQLEVEPNTAIKLGAAYLSSGGDYVHLANNEWYDGSSWRQTGTGALIQIAGEGIYFYRHAAGGGGHTLLAYVSTGGDVCNAAGRCLGSAPALRQTSCFWQNFATHGSYVCPVGYYVAGVCTTNAFNGCNPSPLGAQTEWVAAGGVLCCVP